MAVQSDISTAGSAVVKDATHMGTREVTQVVVTNEKEAAMGNGHVHFEDSRQTEYKEDEEDDEEEEEDLDALIEELESLDPDEPEEELESVVGVAVPEELLQTDTRTGLNEPEVTLRRKKYGLNQMKEEKENLFLKYLMYFVGPIQFVMEVSL